MRVVSRKVGEKVRISDGVCLKVLEVVGDRVRLGVLAPPGARVVPAEQPGTAGAHPHGKEADADKVGRGCGIPA